MEDATIIDLYWNRSETAIVETNRKYGGYCQSIAFNILSSKEDAEECVNDTWHKTWNKIPPERPNTFRAWLGKIVRNLALDRWRQNHAKKRDCGMNQLLLEFEDCVPNVSSVEQSVEANELSRVISDWLDTLSQADRRVFIRRYWHGEALHILAQNNGITPGKLAQKMYRLRVSLKTYLEQEGVVL